jgi:hypothetical protein
VRAEGERWSAEFLTVRRAGKKSDQFELSGTQARATVYVITRKRVVAGQQEDLPSYAWCLQDEIGHEMPQGDDANCVWSVSRGVHDGLVCYRQETGQTMASRCQQCTVTAKKRARERRGHFFEVWACGVQVDDRIEDIEKTFSALNSNLQGACNVTYAYENSRCTLPVARQDQRPFDHLDCCNPPLQTCMNDLDCCDCGAEATVRFHGMILLKHACTVACILEAKSQAEV